MAKREVIRDIARLHIKSEPVDINSSETNSLLLDLFESLPKGQLGLAAPQIDVQKRVFIAWLPFLNKTIGFVNPKFKAVSGAKQDSTEGCLSLPMVRCTVDRFSHVRVNAERMVEFSEDGTFVDIDGSLELMSLESFIVQHEIDHLDGILITDLPKVKSNNEIMQEKYREREHRLAQKRQNRKQKKLLKK